MDDKAAQLQVSLLILLCFAHFLLRHALLLLLQPGCGCPQVSPLYLTDNV